jgi:hypothetical protein
MAVVLNQRSQPGAHVVVRIYVLRDPRTGRVFYVGQTKNTLKLRRRTGWNKRVMFWLKVLERFLKIAPIYPEQIAQCTLTNAAETEMKWIQHFSKNNVLLNCTNEVRTGGVVRHAPHSIDKMRKAHAGKKMSKQQKLKISRALRGKKKAPFTKQHKHNLRLAHLGQHVSKERRAHTSKVHTGKKVSKATCLKLKLLATARWKDDAFRAHTVTAIQNAGKRRSSR